MGSLNDKEQPVSSGGLYWLSDGQVQEISQKASNGDKDAAFRLSNYYSFSELDEKSTEKWLLVAAKKGHVTAQYNLAVYFLSKNNLRDALYWAEQAKKNENQFADDLLKTIKKKQKKFWIF